MLFTLTHTEYIHTVYVSQNITYVYKHLYVYAPALEATATTVFIVWLRARLNPQRTITKQGVFNTVDIHFLVFGSNFG